MLDESTRNDNVELRPMRGLKIVREEVGLKDVVRIESPGFEILTVGSCAHGREFDAVWLETETRMTFLQKRSWRAPDAAA